ncbi:MAG TPA: NAD-dependent dehydratase [Actinobacteria bacterium]|nr:NAD-dependent dehydratase [Actinomycetota bacterium]
MRVLVTGGAGFLGRALVSRLLAVGDDVVVLDNLSSPSPLGVPDGARLIVGDVIDPPDVGGPFARIFHMASPASPPRYLLDPIGTLRAGAEGTRRMLDLAGSWGARLLYTSTSEVYGDPEVHPQSESYSGSVSLLSSRACYDEAKRYGEALVYAYRRAGVVEDSRVARIFNTYGPGMDPADGRIVSNLLVQALKGQPLTIYGDGAQTRSFCYVDDMIEGLLRLAESDHRAPMNLGNPDEITISQFADVVAQMVGDTGREHRALPEGDPQRRRPDINLARRVLGWEPSVSLAIGMERTRTYFEGLL